MIAAGKIFPYNVLSELAVVVTSIELVDGNGATKTVAPGAIKSGRLPLHGGSSDIPAWRDVAITIECEVTSGEFDKVASDEKNVDFVVAMRDAGTRSRWSCAGTKLPGGRRWVASFSLSRRSLRGAIEVSPYLVRTSDSAANVKGMAKHRGAVIGWAAPLTVFVDEPTSLPISGDVDVRWVSFNDDLVLRPARDRMFLVDVLGARPIVRLNSDHEDLRRAMTYKGRQGAQVALRQAIYSYIVHEAWMAIAFDALQSARVATDDADGVVSFPDVEWKADALTRVLRQLYRELDPDAALGRLLDLYRDPSSMPHLVAQMSFAIQGTINVKRHLVKHLGGPQ